MAVRRGGLGRGLDALIRDPKNDQNNSQEKSEAKSGSETKKPAKSEKKEGSGKKKAKKGDNSDSKSSKAGKKTSYPDSFASTKDEKEESVVKTTTTTKKTAVKKPAPTKTVVTADTAKKSIEDTKEAAVGTKTAKVSTTVSVKTSELKATVSEEPVKVEAPAIVQPAPVEEVKPIVEALQEAPAPVVDENKLFSEGEHVVRISLVEPNREQPRKTFSDESIKELAESIKIHGVIQPLLVQAKDDYYEIIAGERRWRASKAAGLKEIPVLVRNYSDQEAVEVSLIENIQREDLNPIEEAMAYRRLMDDFTLTQDEVAGKVSKSRAAVANSVRLLKLSKEVQGMVVREEISEGHARTLLAIDNEIMQKELADQVIKQHLSVRQTEALVKSVLNPKKAKEAKKVDAQREAVFEELASNLRAVVGTKVAINQISKHKGRIEIEYYSDEELERIYDLLLNIKGEGV
ncbi:MAG: ParB/RepB/Spo0J family partition protein [Lachnospiraceae bacterium]|nr:ParB/RepB/Spo0J family partition protein [Candidatus Equihabitans merdae]